MKKHLSVFMLMARSTIYKFIILLIAMSAAEFVMFRLALESALELEAAGLGMVGLETVFQRSHISLVLGAALVLTALMLCLTGCEFGSRQGYMLRRLSISEKSVFVWQGIYDVLCFVILWAVQVLLVTLFCGLYTEKAAAGTVTGQTVFLAFYRSELLHSLLPLDESSRLTRNILLLLGLGCTCAHFPFRQRRGRISAETVALLMLTLVFFVRTAGNVTNDIIVSVLSVLCIMYVLGDVITGEAEYEAKA